jgi:hypothetical protein
MATSRIVAVAAGVVLAGALTAEAQEVSEKTNRDRKVITAEEIEAAHVNTAYQVVEKLRPEILTRMSRPQTLRGGSDTRGATPSARGASSAGGGGWGASSSNSSSSQSQRDPEPVFVAEETRTAAVFVDGTNMGGVEELQRIQSSLVEEIRYLSGPDAGIKYGPRFSAGVVEVKLKSH